MEEFDSAVHLETDTPKKPRWPWYLLILVIAAVAAVFTWYGMNNEKSEPEGEVKPAPVVETPAPVAVDDTQEASFQLNEQHQEFNRYFNRSLLESQLNKPGSGWNLTMFRNLVKTALTAEFLTEMPGMTWEKWESTRKTVLDLARVTLSQPDFVTWLWEQHGPFIVQAAESAGKRAQVLKWLDRTLPFFDGSLPVGQSRTLAEYYRIDQQLEQELKKQDYDPEKIRELTIELDDHYRDLTNSGLDRDDIYLFEFSRRRLKEGGRELLDAYTQVLEAFRSALKAENESGASAEGE